MSQLEIVSLDSLLSSTHPHRRFDTYVPDVMEGLAEVVHVSTAAEGYGSSGSFAEMISQTQGAPRVISL